MRILSEIDFALSNSKCQCKDALLIVSEWSVVSKNSEFLPGWGGAQIQNICRIMLCQNYVKPIWNSLKTS